jgi:endonuclease/exonuclease/phosphatase family metal-dependent hydrolase
MKFLNILFIIIFALFLSNCEWVGSNSCRIMTYNIRYDDPNAGENSWENRKGYVISLIDSLKPQIFGLQEAMIHQIYDIHEKLPTYKWVGNGRDDGKTKGEFTAIFYNDEELEIIRASTFWCSQTPGLPGIGWDAAYYRTVTWVEIKNKKTENHFIVMNTHFDHIGEIARVQSARLVKRVINDLFPNFPVILMGDFNVIPESEPYAIITGGSDQAEDDRIIQDSYSIASERTKLTGTFNGFDIYSEYQYPIDYIFVTTNIQVNSYQVVKQKFENRYPSDHFPVVVDVKFD